MQLDLPFPKDSTLLRDGDSGSVRFLIEESFPYLDGHFPGNPLVPAVTQIGWVKRGVELLRGEKLVRYRLGRFKFVKPILPGDDVLVEFVANDLRYTIRTTVNGELCSTGNLTVIRDD